MTMTIPVGSGPNPPPGHSSSLGGISAAVGSIRYNPVDAKLEIYSGTQWMAVASNTNPQTWREWLDYYANEIIDHGGVDHKLLYIRNKMQERFPGAYSIKHVGNGEFDLDFDTPEDQTWFHLKYE